MLCLWHHWRTQGVCEWLCLVKSANIRESTKHAKWSTSLVTDGTCVVRGDCLSSWTGPGASVCPYWTCPVNRTTPYLTNHLPITSCSANCNFAVTFDKFKILTVYLWNSSLRNMNYSSKYKTLYWIVSDFLQYKFLFF